MVRWTRRLEDAVSSAANSYSWTRVLLLPYFLDRWINRSYGKMFYRLIQLMTGYERFNAFLCRISRISFPWCNFCQVPRAQGEEDSAAHTLVHCKTFDGERPVPVGPVRTLVCKIGLFNLPALVHKMLKSPRLHESRS